MEQKSKKEKYILVTGAAGFLGSNLVKHLAENDNQVLATTRNPNGPIPLVKYYFKGLEHNIEWVTLDIRNYDAVIKLKDKFNIKGIIHAAVFTGITPEVEKEYSREILESNIMGTVNTLELAKISNSSSYVYVSSSGLYGIPDNKKKPILESSNKPYIRKQGFYGISKLASENITERYNKLYTVVTSSMRVASPYGNMERPTNTRYIMGPIYRLLYLICTENKNEIKVKGQEYERDWTFVTDTVRLLEKGLEKSPSMSQIFNVSCGVNHCFGEILDIMMSIDSLDFTWEEVENEETADLFLYPNFSCAPLSIERAKKELGFKPKYDIVKGLEEYYSWWIEASKKGYWPPRGT